eukprot:102015-Pelagomonas_calceolata.AAC.1
MSIKHYNEGQGPGCCSTTRLPRPACQRSVMSIKHYNEVQGPGLCSTTRLPRPACQRPVMSTHLW